MGYYDKYKDFSVQDLLLRLEDANWHTEEGLVEALAQLDYDNVVKICEIVVEHNKTGYLTDDLCKKRQEIDKELRKGAIKIK